MKPFIKIVELHFSNKCTGDCVICSEAHGGNNSQLCTVEVVDKIIENLKGVDFNILQVGGDGDSFLNKEVFFYGLRRLRKEFPHKQICLYSNGSLLTEENARTIVDEGLLDDILTRIDSLNPVLYKQSTGLNLEKVLNNFKHFFAISESVKCCIIYFPLYAYRDMCIKMLGREPARWNRIDNTLLRNEYQEMRDYFSIIPKNPRMRFSIRPSQISLWGERRNVPPRDVDCFQRSAEEFTTYLERGLLLKGELCCHGSFINQTYIYPNGTVGLCPYDDGQDTFILGDLMKDDSLADIWVSERRKQIIQDIRDRKYNGKYPCIDPIACGMYDV
jgi:MoaA/NifB/PqqE/SkfB family radical SAM enzyme